MKINKLSVMSFGGLSDREFELKDGLNVIYGSNESGKSTLISFIRFVLFGSHGRKSSNAVSFDEKYSPWNNTSMTGSIEFETEGITYLTSRSHGIRKEYKTVNVSTGDTRFEGVVPGEILYKMNESSFLRSFYLSSASCAISAEKNDDILKGLSNLSETGDESVSYEALKNRINSDRKTAVSELNNIQNEIDSLKNKLERINSLKQQAKEISEKLDFVDSEMDSISTSVENKLQDNDKYRYMLEKYASARLYQQSKVIICALLSILAVVMCVFSMFVPAVAIAVCDLICVVLLYTGSKKIKRIKRKLKEFRKNSNTNTESLKQNINNNNEIRTDLLKEAGAIEAELEKEYTSDDILGNIDMLTQQMCQLKRKIDKTDKALQMLECAYGELKGLFSPVLNEKTSEIFSKITGNKYPGVVVNDSFDIKVKSEYDYKSAGVYSASTYEMMYLSLRLALCDLLSSGEKMPLFLDDCFVLCDDKRAETALRFIAEYASSGRQIIFCTCHSREKYILEKLAGVNVIDLNK